jgi:hypothetical protein
MTPFHEDLSREHAIIIQKASRLLPDGDYDNSSVLSLRRVNLSLQVGSISERRNQIRETITWLRRSILGASSTV